MKIAAITDNEVFFLFETQYSWNGNVIQQALLNNPLIVDTTHLDDVLTGYVYNEGKFYKSTDVEKINPIQEIPVDQRPWKKITFVYNNEVVMSLTPSPEFYLSDLVYAGLLSNPIFLDVTNVDGIDLGWTWDGQFFNPPMNG